MAIANIERWGENKKPTRDKEEAETGKENQERAMSWKPTKWSMSRGQK